MRRLRRSGSPAGLTADDHQIWDQSIPGIADQAEPGDQFGRALAVGDFDDDGCADLAVGVPFEELAGILYAGAVHVLYGGPGGLSGDGDQFLHQEVGDLATEPDENDAFGGALAAGDLDADGIDDLAIGVRGEDVSGTVFAGMVHVLYGSVSGLLTNGTTSLRRGIELAGPAQDFDLFGASLAIGNLSGFVGEELAVGVPGHDLNGHPSAGAVVLISDVDEEIFDSLWHQDATDVPGVADDLDGFGGALAAGDFDGDGLDELAVGVPGEDRESPLIPGIGAVNVLDFDGGNHQLWTQDDLPPQAQGENELLGWDLAAGDFDGDGVDDLAMAAPGEDRGSLDMVGLVLVLSGEEGTGLVATGAQSWRQTIDPTEEGDRFGEALAVGRFAGHSADDLVVGVPWETVLGAVGAGGVNVIYSAVLLRDGFETGDTSAWSTTSP